MAGRTVAQPADHPEAATAPLAVVDGVDDPDGAVVVVVVVVVVGGSIPFVA